MPSNGNTSIGEKYITDTTTSPPPSIPSLIQSTCCKSSISFLFSNNNNTKNKKKSSTFTNSTFRGLGCAAASPQVSVPAVIRTSAEWEGKKVGKKKQRKKKTTHHHHHHHQEEEEHQNQGVVMANNPNPLSNCSSSSSSSSSSDVWCGPPGGAADDDAPVDCLPTRRNFAGRGKIDGGDKINSRERSFPARRTTNPEHILVPEFDSGSRSETDIFGTRHYRHVRHRSPEGFAEILMLRSSLLMGGVLDSRDRFRDWRLDIDGMTYEELLALGDKIGHVSTGLKENEMSRYLRKIKLSILDNLSSHFSRGTESRCSICQEEYKADDEMGKLNCEHAYHMHCIKQWLLQKNACPVCKSEVVARR